MPNARKRVCVLVADDETNIADSLALVLESHGFRAIPVYSGEDAVEQARTLQPGVLIADIQMPGMSGLEAACRIKADVPACRVLLVTGQTVIRDLTAIEAGGQEFQVLQKPFHPRLLLKLLGEA